jgi:uncharacterized protein YndB with AHSA1/START domain
MLKKILLAVVAIVAVLAIVVLLQPADFRIARTTHIAAPPADVFAQVNDFHRWEAWSPWAKLDPAAKVTFAGQPAGSGAVFTWAGNDKVGEGRMMLTESRPNELVSIEVDFVKPFEGHSRSEFALQPDGSQTVVTWTMSGHNNLVARALCLFVSMDRMLGSDMERGLTQMKSVVEARRDN